MGVSVLLLFVVSDFQRFMYSCQCLSHRYSMVKTFFQTHEHLHKTVPTCNHALMAQIPVCIAADEAQLSLAC